MSDSTPPSQNNHWLDLASPATVTEDPLKPAESHNSDSATDTNDNPNNNPNDNPLPPSPEPEQNSSDNTSDKPSDNPPPMKPIPFKRHLKFIVGLIVIGFLILGVGVAWLLSQVNHPTTVADTATTPTPTILHLNTTPTPTPSTTPTSTPSPTPTPTTAAIDKSTIHIIVLNGTGQKGLAASVAKQLTQAGFIVDKTGNADSQTHASLAYPTGQDAAAALIASTLQSAYPNMTQQATNNATQYTLILGQ